MQDRYLLTELSCTLGNPLPRHFAKSLMRHRMTLHYKLAQQHIKRRGERDHPRRHS